jgi:hypothetical protein
MHHNVYNWQRFEHDVPAAPSAQQRLERARRKSLRATSVVVVVLSASMAVQVLILALFSGGA